MPKGEEKNRLLLSAPRCLLGSALNERVSYHPLFKRRQPVILWVRTPRNGCLCKGLSWESTLGGGRVEPKKKPNLALLLDSVS